MNSSSDGHSVRQPALPAATLAALGIVFGDIGTSPLYAFRECFASHGIDPTPMTPTNLVGAASLIVWALILVVSIKYVLIILRLDNRGEGGILALSALIRSAARRLGGKDPKAVLLLGLAGSSLIYADGMITPSISVLSAVEGLTVISPEFSKYVVPVAVCILILMFSIQRHGTGKVGILFGPVVLCWFVTLGLLGLRGIIQHPEVLSALSPASGIMFLIHEWHHAFPLLAAVFLAVTGGEALYADLGHFGTRPIRVGWFSVVLPGLVLNYLGQAALLSHDPKALEAPFFLLAPDYLRLPLTILATAAAAIASQALISGAFSLTTQAVQLGCLPRVKVRHTSEHSVGQVYVPFVNRFLLVACIVLVITFKSSAALAGAYGIAIVLTMTITSILFYSAARAAWGWSTAKAATVTSLFLILEIPFLAANTLKVIHGGWLPLVVAGSAMGLMLTWLWGRARLYKRLSREALPIDALLGDLKRGQIHRVSGTAVYMSGRGDTVPTALLHNLKHNQVLHERVVLLHVDTLDQPHADPETAVAHTDLGEGLHRVNLSFGFADTPDVPVALKAGLPAEVKFHPGKATYVLGRETYGVGKNASALDRLRLALFAVMARNASPATAYFRLPPGRVVELGAQITL
ncbi:KUP/HAK/KT family potassium transporter [Luteolibacter flavescens]|uniref:Probable potassium transport system protein Kup n=1 Tax=Luteolibacter flavescens TaxID=1859460 RepID=A0ABT3FJN1_9BACT|nr:KUP/HAK/KT family potassium transporter [Luteolibacter flavescens]MCW1883429.1 KUP/HAK/KT family potassium transporter [Luteolibacter flavescens]